MTDYKWQIDVDEQSKKEACKLQVPQVCNMPINLPNSFRDTLECSDIFQYYLCVLSINF